MILDKSWNHPSTPLFKELNLLPIQSCITYHVALLVFKIHTDIASYYLNTIHVLLFTSNSRYELRSESRCHLAQPKKKSYYSNQTLQSSDLLNYYLLQTVVTNYALNPDFTQPNQKKVILFQPKPTVNSYIIIGFYKSPQQKNF